MNVQRMANVYPSNADVSHPGTNVAENQRSLRHVVNAVPATIVYTSELHM